MRNIFLLALNTLKVTFRKKRNIFIYLLLPAIAAVFIVALYSTEGGGSVNIGICNMAGNSQLSQDFISSIKLQDKFKVISIKSSDIKDAVVSQKADCVLVIPENFDESVLDGSFDKLEITSIRGYDQTAWTQNYINFYMRSLMDISKASAGNKALFDKIYKGFRNQNLKLKSVLLKDEYHQKTVSEQSVGTITMLMLMTATTTAGFILKEKRERTYFRIFASPVSSKVYVMGNVLSNMIIALVQSVAVVMTMSKILKTNIMMPEAELIFLLFLFGIVCIGFGMLLVAFSNNTNQSSHLATLIVIPTSMLSGCLWPVTLMPDFMQKLSYFFPQRWLLEAIKKLQDGQTLFQDVPCIAIMLSFAAVFFLIAIYKMKSNNSVQNFV